MKSRNDFKVLFLVSNGNYHPNECPQIMFPLGPARLAARLKKAGYETYILDTQAEGLLQVVLRKKTRRLGSFVGLEPELVLNKGGERGFDTVEVGLPDDQLLERIRSYKPDIILATHTFSTQTGPLARQIDRILSDTTFPVIIGGVAASMYPDSLGEHRQLVYRGKFDDYIVDLIDAHRTGQGIDQFEDYKVKFAQLKHHDRVIDVEPLAPNLFPNHRIPIDIYDDARATFEREVSKQGCEEFQKNYPFVSIEKDEIYFQGPIYTILLFGRLAQTPFDGLVAHVVTREGCIFVCEGCHIAVETRLGNPLGILIRKIVEVASELEELRALGYKKVILGDDQALLPKNYIIDLAKSIMPLGLEFHLPNGILVNAIAKMDTETLCTLMRAGFCSYSLSVESASQEIVEQYWDSKIPSVIETTIKACNKLKKASKEANLPIRVEAYFVIGCAGMTETRETLDQIYHSICFGRYLIDNNLADYIVFSLYTPSPGTLSYENLKKWGMMIDPYAMTFGLYAIDGEGFYSPRSIEALHLAGWLFANRKEIVESRSYFNLEPEIDSDPHAHIDKNYCDHHLKMLEGHYDDFLKKMFVDFRADNLL